MPRKVIFMVSLRSYRNQLSSAPCNYKTKMNFQKTALFVFSKCIVLGARHVWCAWLSWFCTYCDWKNGDFSYISSLTGRYKGDQKLVLHTFSILLSNYSIFYFETDWSRIQSFRQQTGSNPLLYKYI